MTATREEIVSQLEALQAQLQALDADTGAVVVRSRDSGCWLGQLTYRTGDEVGLTDARRLYYWDGAATLSQLALEGVSKPGNCKFPPALSSVTVLGVCEVIPATAEAVRSIAAVKPWRS